MLKALCLSLLLSIPVFAQTLPSPKSTIKLFENATIAPGKTPITLRGISGGSKETQELSRTPKTETGECIGFVDSNPDHEITLTAQLNYLRLSVKSPGDTILLIKGPGGTWCNDDSTDRNPRIEGQWLAGTYQIWVGSYSKDTSYPYLLEISESP
ncbi:MAG: hypothetical protein RMK91_12275 [Pseudanabaenaceae cyanobacterium SKYGB_i_bin29]|nr:hypothetical protein [Pseudanabaenaceae cyanobacterium SKYG29]MDW8422630.1 hypothetical protein [Pseudanabaenaceae cyanobacterium SKYGB_i_bin29]